MDRDPVGERVDCDGGDELEGKAAVGDVTGQLLPHADGSFTLNELGSYGIGGEWFAVGLGNVEDRYEAKAAHEPCHVGLPGIGIVTLDPTGDRSKDA